MSHNCNDFIIKEGQFVRDFEGMYQEIEDPWEQNELAEFHLFNSHALFHLSKIFPSIKEFEGEGSVLDAGCGFGNHAGILSSIVDGTYVGVDVSETAIGKAKLKNKGELYSFEANDLTKHTVNFSNSFDLIYSSQTLYYLGPEIDEVIKNLLDYLKKSGVLCFVYNQSADSFSNQWLTHDLLRKKLLEVGLFEKSFFKIVRYLEKENNEEDCAIGIFQKNN
jgi:SAM-dependent methyltransferase